MAKPKNSVEEIGREYQNRPRVFIISFLILIFLFLIIQSYIAQARSFQIIFSDFWEFSLLFLIVIYVFWKRKVCNLLYFGIFFLIIFFLMLFKIINFIEPFFGTLFFLCSVWFLGDWISTKKFGRGIFTELLKGNYYLAIGILLSTLLLGIVVELANLPFKLWWYEWTIPSIEIYGLPVFYIVFGWFPWILAIFVIFYPWATRKPKKINNQPPTQTA